MAHMQMMGEENARLMGEVARLEAEVEVAGAEAERRGRTAAQQLGRERAKNKVQCSVVRGHSDPPPPPGAGVPAAGRAGGRGRGRHPGGGRGHQQAKVSLGGGQGGLPPRQRSQQRGQRGRGHLQQEEQDLQVAEVMARDCQPPSSIVCRSQIKQLQAEVERLRSLLAREVGQPQVQPLLEGRPSSGWRGRAKTIDNLK